MKKSLIKKLTCVISASILVAVIVVTNNKYSNKILSMIDSVKSIEVNNDSSNIVSDNDSEKDTNIIEEIVQQNREESNIIQNALNRNKEYIQNKIKELREKFNI